MEKLKILNRNHLKIIAIITMAMDHATPLLFENGSIMWLIIRMISRITLPMMVYFLVEGFIHTHNLKKYIFRMFVFSIVSYFSFSFIETGSILPIHFVSGTVDDYVFTSIYFPSKDMTLCISMFSIITNLLLALLVLTVWERTKWKTIVKVLLTVLMLALSLYCDWSYFPILSALSFYYFRKKKCIMWIAYFALSALYIFNFVMFDDLLAFDTYFDIRFILYRVGMVFPFLLIEFFYNGKPGKNTKAGRWFFYIFYPAHQILIGIITLLV